MGRTKSASVEPGGADEYIAACPKEVQGKLKKIKAATREVAPGLHLRRQTEITHFQYHAPNGPAEARL